LVPNGVSIAAYENMGTAPAIKDPHLPGPVVGLVGHLSARIDISLLEGVVNAGCSLLLVGPHDPRWEAERFRALAAHHRVRWVGRRPFSELPSFLRHMDVGITPYRDTEFNRASFPLKTLEYLAAGLPAVSTDLPATRWLKTDLVRVADDERGFIEATVAAADESADPQLVAQRRSFATQHSWCSRAADVARILGLSKDVV
jgi:teichuronic acid biosynthesis glycosyltransferase TuaH